jgi:hypothetical protein
VGYPGLYRTRLERLFCTANFSRFRALRAQTNASFYSHPSVRSAGPFETNRKSKELQVGLVLQT